MPAKNRVSRPWILKILTKLFPLCFAQIRAMKLHHHVIFKRSPKSSVKHSRESTKRKQKAAKKEITLLFLRDNEKRAVEWELNCTFSLISYKRYAHRNRQQQQRKLPHCHCLSCHCSSKKHVDDSIHEWNQFSPIAQPAKSISGDEVMAGEHERKTFACPLILLAFRWHCERRWGMLMCPASDINRFIISSYDL